MTGRPVTEAGLPLGGRERVHLATNGRGIRYGEPV
jgi:hypothetical protein